jgi:putative DNA primase/helicase
MTRVSEVTVMEPAEPRGAGQATCSPNMNLDQAREVFAGNADSEHSAQAENQPVPRRTFPRTDSGNAELFAHVYKDEVLFDHKQQRWLAWDTHRSRWVEDRTWQVRELAKNVSPIRIRMAVDRPARTNEERAEQASEIKWAWESHNLYRINAFLELAKSSPVIVDTGDLWDQNPWLLGVANGVVDLRTGNLHAGTKDDRITKFAPVAFDASARCPRFEQFMAETLGGDSALIAYVQAAIGYTLTGSTQEQCFFACHGTGRNGKSTLFEIIMYIMGDYGTDLPFNVLEKKKHIPIGEGTNLPGARFAKSVETREDLQMDEARIKSWTGGDTITINPKFRAPFSFTPTHKIWLAFNHKPRVTDDSIAMWRRVRMIPFNHRFDAGQADKGLLEKLKGEASGILNWAIVGCLAWLRDGLTMPTAVEQATNDYAKESDLLAPFFEDRCEIGSTFQVSKGELRKAYEDWCASNQENPLNRTVFPEKMLNRDFKQGSTGKVRYWSGLRLRSPDTTDTT